MARMSEIGTALTAGQAGHIVDPWEIASFANHDISVLFPDQGTSQVFAQGQNTKVPAGFRAGGLVGRAFPGRRPTARRPKSRRATA